MKNLKNNATHILQDKVAKTPKENEVKNDNQKIIILAELRDKHNEVKYIEYEVDGVVKILSKQHFINRHGSFYGSA